MPTSPHIRQPCGASQPSKPSLNGCFETFRTPETPIYKNVTKVFDHGNPSVPTDPYTRLYPYTGPCLPDPLCDAPYPCTPFTSSDVVSSGLTLDNGPFYNSFTATSSLADKACEYTLGWRQVAAKKNWFGKWGYTANIHGAYDQISSLCDLCSKQYSSTTSDLTKYLKISATSTYKSASVVKASYEKSVEVNRYSGVSTIVTSSTGADPELATCITNIAFANNNNGTLAARFCYYQNNLILQLPDIGNTVYTDNLHLQWYDPSDTFIQWDMTYSLSGNTFTIIQNGWDGLNTYVYEQEDWSFTETTMHYKYYILPSDLTYEVNATLSNPYTAEQLRQDVDYLSSLYPINDDNTLAWQWVSWHGQVPLVSYDEPKDGGAGELSLNYIEVGDYTGEILGRPIVSGSSDRFFNFRQEVYKPCETAINGVILEGWGQWNTDAGQHRATTQWVDPYRVQLNMYKGAFLNYKKNTGELWSAKWAETIIPKKSMNLARPCGLNDRWQMDPASASCAVTFADPNLILQADPKIQTGELGWVYGVAGLDNGIYTFSRTDPTTYTVTPVVSGSQIPLSFDGGSYGFVAKLRWQGGVPAFCGRNYVLGQSTGNSPITLSLEKQGLVDGDKVFAFDANGNSEYYTARYVSPTQVSFVEWNGTGSFTYLQCAFSADWMWDDNTTKGDFYVLEFQHNYMDMGENNRLALAKSVHEVSSASYCTNYGDVEITQIHIDSGFNQSPIRYSQSLWGFDQSIIANPRQAACVKRYSCNNSVVVITPNGEQFFGGKTYGFPIVVSNTDTNLTLNTRLQQQNQESGSIAIFVPDQRYGSKWNKIPVQTLEDPLWKAVYDGTNCSAGIEDIYACCDLCALVTSTIPHRPVVEALLTLPVGAPQLPNGIHIGCLDQSAINVTTDPRTTGNVCNCPQLYTGYGQEYFIQFMWASYCVCQNGKYSEEYQDQYGVKCVQVPLEVEI